jgi:hypothetical protein
MPPLDNSEAKDLSPTSFEASISGLVFGDGSLSPVRRSVVLASQVCTLRDAGRTRKIAHPLLCF